MFKSLQAAAILITIALAGCSRPATTALTADKSAVEFGTTRLNDTLAVVSPSPGANLLVRPDWECPWLSVTPGQAFSSGPGAPASFTLSVTRALMKPGRNTCTLVLKSEGHADLSIPITVDAFVSADFRSSVSAARVGERVAFSDLTRVMTGAEPVTAWKWEFGDGNTSSEQNPVHSYGAPGVYAVSLAVQSASGSDVRIRPNCVKVSIPDVPKADFVAAARKPTINTPLQFNDLSVPGASDIVGWLWDFGDGAWSAEQHPVHIYNTAAVYDVYLTVNNANGSDTSVKLGYIEVQAGLPQSLPE